MFCRWNFRRLGNFSPQHFSYRTSLSLDFRNPWADKPHFLSYQIEHLQLEDSLQEDLMLCNPLRHFWLYSTPFFYQFREMHSWEGMQAGRALKKFFSEVTPVRFRIFSFFLVQCSFKGKDCSININCLYWYPSAAMTTDEFCCNEHFLRLLLLG